MADQHPFRPGKELTEVADPESPRFLRACRRQPVDCTPVWFMRQAGRYMPEYRALRQKYSMLDLIKQPELSCEVTLQPVEAFALDAAIIFADILPPLEALGFRVGFEAGEGPIIYNPVRTLSDLTSLPDPDPEQAAGSTLEAIRLVRRELQGRGVPLIGFSGAPFTLACYCIEGGTSKDFLLAKRLLVDQPSLWHRLMEPLTILVIRYLRAQAQAGVQAMQLFDTWTGLLGPADYQEFVLPYNQAVVRELSGEGLPLIYFSTGTGGMLELVARTGASVFSLDWRVDLGEAWERLGLDCSVQGNLDPVALLADWPQLEKRARAVLRSAGGRPGHIFNLGHGVLQDTPVDNVRRLVDFVHQYRPSAPESEESG